MNPDWPQAILRAKTYAPFLAHALERRPDLADLLAEGEAEAALHAARNSGEGIEDIGIALRRERLALALVLAIGDLAGAFPLARVMRELSDFADRALDRAISESIARRVPGAEARGFIGLALGKHGACELNYSSDIDPILLFDPETLPRRARDEPGEAAQRYARDIVRLLADNTSEGYVFRVDLRLRPASEVSPLAISVDAATTHYESSALAWERAAFIRARSAAGDIAAGDAFLDSIRSFVWRRSLDFGAIDEIRRLSTRIRERYAGPREPGAGFDVKQGRGGIREVEFYAQTHQLIHGGRDPGLRLRGTRAALDALALAEHIRPEDARILGESYDQLRRIEHRLQMVGDQQTHTLPDGEALGSVARLDGFDGAPAMLAELEEICLPVARRFDAMVMDRSQSPEAERAGNLLADRVKRLGDADRKSFSARVSGWSDGRYRALRSAAACDAFETIKPQLLAALTEAADPEKALTLWETLLARLPSAINFFRLLEARPGLFQVLIDCLTLAPPLADQIAQRPDLLGRLIDRSALDLPEDVDTLAEKMRRSEKLDGYEGVLDRIRYETGEQRFALGVQLIEAAHDPLEISAALSRVAEAALQVAVDATQAEFAAKHGSIDGCELVVLGLGRLGGGALTHASDLDIVFLFTEGVAEESDGARPLGRTLYFNRLAQRVSGALSVPTAEGALYEVDTRLRPQGAQGPLAVGLASFERYQMESAWSWEHMALTRARVLVGSKQASERLGAIVDRALRMERDPAKLREDVLSMRADMAAHKPPQGVLDAKLLRGGLVDLEFLIHYLQLRERIALTPDLEAALAELVRAGLVDEDLREGHALMTRLLVGSRLLAPDNALPAGAAGDVLAQLTHQRDPQQILKALADARQCVAANWREIFGIDLEKDDE